jgi:AcrR family transcriptional regulator
MKKRKYTKTRRAEQQAQTRTRIVEAAVALHEELGPAYTSIKAIAERAGVQRLTVYRYFPDDASLFRACTSHWLAQHPPPDISAWGDIEAADKRCHAALLAFYRYYREHAAMWTGAYRDVDEVPALQAPMAGLEAYLDTVRDSLLPSWQARGHRKQQLSLTLRHCLRFTTWQSLQRDKLSDTQIADLAVSWLHPP